MPDVYVYLYPQDMDARDAKNYHVIMAKYDKYYGLRFPYGHTALDGQFDIENENNIAPSQIISDDINEVREFLAEKQNSGDEVCANCVRRLYADDNRA